MSTEIEPFSDPSDEDSRATSNDPAADSNQIEVDRKRELASRILDSLHAGMTGGKPGVFNLTVGVQPVSTEWDYGRNELLVKFRIIPTNWDGAEEIEIPVRKIQELVDVDNVRDLDGFA